MSSTPQQNTSASFSTVFRPGKLSIGLMTPIEGYPDSDTPTMSHHTELAMLADKLGFPALWLRDVPFRDPVFGDVGQIYDPMVYASWLAAATKRITIGTAGIVLPLRDPLAVAKQATSIDQLSAGRFILGLSTGDRPTEYPAFGMEFENRAARFRDAVGVIKAVTQQRFPAHRSEFYGTLIGELDLVPKPVAPALPTLAIGRCGQDLQWLASNTDGWIWHQPNFARLPDLIEAWQEACGEGRYRPYGYGLYFELDPDPDAPLRISRGIHTGRKALVEFWKQHEALGVAHVVLNLRVSRRPAEETIHELAEHVLPHFS